MEHMLGAISNLCFLGCYRPLRNPRLCGWHWVLWHSRNGQSQTYYGTLGRLSLVFNDSFEMCRELILFSSTAFAQLPAEVCGLQSLLVIEAGLPIRFWLACGPFARDCYLENDSPSFAATH